MKTYLIERDIPHIGAMSPAETSLAVARSIDALAQLAPRIQWQHSYVAGNKTFCIYLAEDDDVIAEHARLSGLPSERVNQVIRRIDPTSLCT